MLCGGTWVSFIQVSLPSLAAVKKISREPKDIIQCHRVQYFLPALVVLDRFSCVGCNCKGLIPTWITFIILLFYRPIHFISTFTIEMEWKASHYFYMTTLLYRESKEGQWGKNVEDIITLSMTLMQNIDNGFAFAICVIKAYFRLYPLLLRHANVIGREDFHFSHRKHIVHCTGTLRCRPLCTLIHMNISDALTITLTKKDVSFNVALVAVVPSFPPGMLHISPSEYILYNREFSSRSPTLILHD